MAISNSVLLIIFINLRCTDIKSEAGGNYVTSACPLMWLSTFFSVIFAAFYHEARNITIYRVPSIHSFTNCCLANNTTDSQLQYISKLPDDISQSVQYILGIDNLPQVTNRVSLDDNLITLPNETKPGVPYFRKINKDEYWIQVIFDIPQNYIINEKTISFVDSTVCVIDQFATFNISLPIIEYGEHYSVSFSVDTYSPLYLILYFIFLLLLLFLD